MKMNCIISDLRVDGDYEIGDFHFLSVVPKGTSIGKSEKMVYSSHHQMRKVLDSLVGL